LPFTAFCNGPHKGTVSYSFSVLSCFIRSPETSQSRDNVLIAPRVLIAAKRVLTIRCLAMDHFVTYVYTISVIFSLNPCGISCASLTQHCTSNVILLHSTVQAQFISRLWPHSSSLPTIFCSGTQLHKHSFYIFIPILYFHIYWLHSSTFSDSRPAGWFSWTKVKLEEVCSAFLCVIIFHCHEEKWRNTIT
jgi:hypothetical protein